MAGIQRPVKRAVVIGINEYSDQKLNLAGAVNDAEEIYKLLKDTDEFTIEPKHFLKDKTATSDNIREAISDLFWKSEEKCDTALFYFAGHGRRDHLNYGYLMPHDADPQAPFVKGIRIQELRDLFLRSDANAKAIMILDCCYSGIATARGVPGCIDDVKSLKNELSLESIGSQDPDGGRFIWVSAGPDEIAREQKQVHAVTGEEHVHGLFSFHLIEGLRVRGDKFGRVSLGALKKHLLKAIEEGKFEHAPQLADVGIDPDRVALTKIGAVFTKERDTRSSQIRTFLGKEYPADLVNAISVFHELDENELDTEESINSLKSLIRNKVECAAGKWSIWWTRHSLKIKREVGESDFYQIVQRNILPQFNIELVRRLDDEKCGFLAQILDYIHADEEQSVINYIRMFDRDYRPTPRIGSESGKGLSEAGPLASASGSVEHVG